jgi:phosphoribosyl 1,2-cyclic phosphate phosphodiesterase
MKITLLGTGAADGIPQFFGRDRVSQFARQYGGKDVRARTGAIIDGCLQIDLNPETHVQLAKFGYSAADWTALVFTHSHDDHYCPSEIQYALFPFVENDHLPFTIFANQTISADLAARYPDWPIDLVTTQVRRCYGHGDYQILPVLATHKDDEECHNLIISNGSSKLFYASDTGFYREEAFLQVADQQCDLLIIECTDGFHKREYVGHLDIELCVQMVERFRADGAIKPGARVVTTHHASSGGATHSELEAALAPYGMEPGFDGLTIEF